MYKNIFSIKPLPFDRGRVKKLLFSRVEQVDGAQIFGSWKFNEETYANINDGIYLLSDVDISVNNLKRQDARIAQLNALLGGLRLDISDASSFKSNAQRFQRTSSSLDGVNIDISHSEIWEALGIRLFYSGLDLVESLEAGSKIGTVYTVIRLAVELPMLLCWLNKIIIGGYGNQLSYAKNAAGLKEIDSKGVVEYCVETKLNFLSFQSVILDNELEMFFFQVVDIYKSFIGLLDGSSKNAEVCRNLLGIFCRMLEPDKRMMLIAQMWSLYELSFDDAKKRSIYLNTRLNNINKPNSILGKTEKYVIIPEYLR